MNNNVSLTQGLCQPNVWFMSASCNAAKAVGNLKNLLKDLSHYGKTIEEFLKRKKSTEQQYQSIIDTSKLLFTVNNDVSLT